MERKRKTIAPSFRLPNPTNPITGDANYLHPPYKQFVRFALDEELTTSDESKLAVITDKGQWGPNPIHHCSQVKIHVHNQLAKDDIAYLFKGEVDDVGLAAWDQNNHWRIIWMVPTGGGGGGDCVATTTDIIPARDGTTAGGPISCQCYELVESTLTSTESVNVWSWIKSDSSDPANEEGGLLWIFIEKDAAGIWWFTGQDCPDGMST
jgi:hypothetical protein